MFWSIAFCVGDKTIELNGREFPLGELTTEVLNITVDAYMEMRAVCDRAVEKMATYEKHHDVGDWFAANEEFIHLEELLCRYRIFRLLRDDSELLQEARQFTEQYSLFPDTDCTLTEYDLDVGAAISDYALYLEHPEEYGGGLIDAGTAYERERPPIPPPPPEKTRALLIYPGSAKDKWDYYKRYCEMFERILFDIRSFNNTIQPFVCELLNDLETLNPNSYVAALDGFLYHERAHKIVAGPRNGLGFYSRFDAVQLQHIPRETFPGSGQYKIYTCYEVNALQALLKIDFYKALETGYTIRRCVRCKRYFLLKNARHTKYCDLPDLKDPRYTCAQMGYHIKGVKEAAGDSPRAGSLQRCYQRIDKDLSRGIITEREKELLYRKAKDLYHKAETMPGISYNMFEESLASKNLYALCGVVRKTKPRGRPRKG